MEPSAYSLPVTGPGNPAWLDQVLQGPGSVATAQFSEDPFIKLRKKLAADQKALLDRRRMADDAVLPQIIEDYKQSSARADAIMQRIDVAMGSLNAPPPQMGQPRMNEGENLAGALTAVIAPDVLPQVLQGLSQASTQRNEVEFENTLRAYGLTRETSKMALSQLMGRLDREYGIMDGARKQEAAIRHAGMVAEAGIIEKGMEQEFAISMAEAKEAGVDDRAAMAYALKEMGYAQKDIELKLKEWELKNIKKPESDSRIAKREADIELAKQKFSQLKATDKQKIAIQMQKLRAEFGRLTVAQQRNAILEKGLGIAGYNAETGRYNAELRKWQSMADALGLGDAEHSLFENLLGRGMVGDQPEAPNLNFPDVPADAGHDVSEGVPPKKGGLRGAITNAGSFLGGLGGKLNIRPRGVDPEAHTKPQPGANYQKALDEYNYWKVKDPQKGKLIREKFYKLFGVYPK